jgi:DNA-binding response OmpR family regulator
MKILLAEDDKNTSRIALLCLTKKGGHEVVLAEDGAQALRLAAEVRPDLILLDWMMPVLDGFEALKRLKADPETKGIPVIMLSSRSEESEIREVLALGAVGYIAKPFNLMTLADQVGEVLSKAGRQGGL